MPLLDALASRGLHTSALDGCVLKCASACLATAGVVADTHLVLSDYGVKKRQHADFDFAQAQQVYAAEVRPAARALLDAVSATSVMEGADAPAQS